LRNRAAATLAVAALAVAGSLALRTPHQGFAADGTAEIPVTASLDSCSALTAGRGGPSCEIAVAFDPLAGAVSYEVTISAPGGSPLVISPAQPDEAKYAVPYDGNGTYGVHVTAFGPPA
jgi:hypothetical protein